MFSKKSVILIIIVIVIALLAGGSVFLIKKNSNEKKNISSNQQEIVKKTIVGPSEKEWKEKYGLDLKDSQSLTKDTDQDGLNNFQEYQKGTDYRDPKSR